MIWYQWVIGMTEMAAAYWATRRVLTGPVSHDEACGCRPCSRRHKSSTLVNVRWGDENTYQSMTEKQYHKLRRDYQWYGGPRIEKVDDAWVLAQKEWEESKRLQVPKPVIASKPKPVDEWKESKRLQVPIPKQVTAPMTESRFAEEVRHDFSQYFPPSPVWLEYGTNQMTGSQLTSNLNAAVSLGDPSVVSGTMALIAEVGRLRTLGVLTPEQAHETVKNHCADFGGFSNTLHA